MHKCAVPRFFKRTVIASFLFLFLGFAFASYDAGANSAEEKFRLPQHDRELIIDEKLLSALIYVESSNNPLAHKKRTGARGLTQITRPAWKDLVRHFPEKYKHLKYKQDIFKPHIARQAGNDYLKVLKRYLKKKNMPVTLENLMASYNWGITSLSRKGLQRAPRETRRYIEKIKRYLKALEMTEVLVRDT